MHSFPKPLLIKVAFETQNLMFAVDLLKKDVKKNNAQ